MSNVLGIFENRRLCLALSCALGALAGSAVLGTHNTESTTPVSVQSKVETAYTGSPVHDATDPSEYLSEQSPINHSSLSPTDQLLAETTAQIHDLFAKAGMEFDEQPLYNWNGSLYYSEIYPKTTSGFPIECKVKLDTSSDEEPVMNCQPKNWSNVAAHASMVFEDMDEEERGMAQASYDNLLHNNGCRFDSIALSEWKPDEIRSLNGCSIDYGLYDGDAEAWVSVNGTSVADAMWD